MPLLDIRFQIVVTFVGIGNELGETQRILYTLIRTISANDRISVRSVANQEYGSLSEVLEGLVGKCSNAHEPVENSIIRERPRRENSVEWLGDARRVDGLQFFKELVWNDGCAGKGAAGLVECVISATGWTGVGPTYTDEVVHVIVDSNV